MMESCTLPRKDLKDTPLTEGITLYVDSSSRKSPDGTNKTGYAIVTKDMVVEAKALPPHYSVQAAELVALIRACEIDERGKGNIYTDSQYAHSTLFIFANQWKNRGMVTSTGKKITHGDLLNRLLSAILLPKAVAVCKCAAHKKGDDSTTLGNNFADETAKEATERQIFLLKAEFQTES